MSKKTQDLIKGLKQMLKNRGSMTVKEVQLVNKVILHLEKHDQLKGEERSRSGIEVVEMLLRIFSIPAISDALAEAATSLVDKLL